jgi:hypothetical protein
MVESTFVYMYTCAVCKLCRICYCLNEFIKNVIISWIWPANIPTFEKIQRKFSSACLDLALRVFDVISVGLDLEVKLTI